jgi:hypothetical protein
VVKLLAIVLIINKAVAMEAVKQSEQRALLICLGLV